MNNDIKKLRKDLRVAVADYIGSEGCGCCAANDHGEDAERIAILLNVPKCDDGSGYNFSKYETQY